MTASERTRRQEALDWARRIHDPTFRDWDAHVEWLERSPENARALDDALLDLEAATEGLAPSSALGTSTPAAANDDEAPAPAGPRRVRAALAGAALAAGVVAAVATWTSTPPSRAETLVRTPPGRMRDLMLEDGSRIALNGGTAMRLDPRTPRTIVLERGEALFSVAHDARRPFEVRVGDAVVRDVGTVFDVAADHGRIEVGVREGAVEFVRAGTTVALAAGDTLRSAGPDAAVVAKTDPGGIGGWRTGRLAYTQTTMSDVAQDLTRVTGTPFAVDPDVADRRFSGVISVAGDGPTVARRVEAVTGLALSRSAQGWRITSPHR